nr:MAG TPA: hypothetical protein [Caudoviricetes sp.]
MSDIFFPSFLCIRHGSACKKRIGEKQQKVNIYIGEEREVS